MAATAGLATISIGGLGTASAGPTTATGDPTLVAPTTVQGIAGNQEVALTWVWPPPDVDPAQTVTQYDTQYSTDGGTTWTAGPSTTEQPAPLSLEVDGLTNGTAYIFEVAAEDALGPGPWSLPSDSLTPEAPPPTVDASALTTPVGVVIPHGAAAVLSTTLRDAATHAAISGASVTLINGNTASVIRATTNAQGIATASIRPTANNRYQWKYAGTTFHKPAFGGVISVSVARVVQAALTTKKLKLGAKDAVYGTVLPTAAGTGVVVQQQRPSGSWKTLPSPAVLKRQKLPNGKKANGFVYPYRPTKKGTEKLRVVCAPTATNLAGVSATLTLKVIKPKKHHKNKHHKKKA